MMPYALSPKKIHFRAAIGCGDAVHNPLFPFHLPKIFSPLDGKCPCTSFKNVSLPKYFFLRCMKGNLRIGGEKKLFLAFFRQVRFTIFILQRFIVRRFVYPNRGLRETKGINLALHTLRPQFHSQTAMSHDDRPHEIWRKRVGWIPLVPYLADRGRRGNSHRDGQRGEGRRRLQLGISPKRRRRLRHLPVFEFWSPPRFPLCDFPPKIPGQERISDATLKKGALWEGALPRMGTPAEDRQGFRRYDSYKKERKTYS